VIESPIAGYLGIYRRKFPDVDVRLFEDGGARLPDRVLQGDVHVAILPAGDERLQGRSLFPMHLLAVLPKTHALRHRTTLEVTNLADNPLMVGSGFRIARVGSTQHARALTSSPTWFSRALRPTPSLPW
jgi:hypothetical protein